MIKINRQQYEDKVYACWLGKNIGGTIGTPYEGKRELLDVKGFKTEPGNPLPNDDLDLQLIWLKAMREVGPMNICAILSAKAVLLQQKPVPMKSGMTQSEHLMNGNI